MKRNYKKNYKRIIKFIRRFKNILFKLFRFVMIYMIRKMLVLLKKPPELSLR